MPAMKPRKAEKSRAPATTGDASSAPATASEGALPTVSGSGPGEWNDSLVAGIAQVCAGRDLGDNGALEKARAGIAAMTGIRPGDVIVTFDGRRVEDASHLLRLLADASIGNTVALTVIRDSREVDLDVEIGRARSRR